MQPQPNAAAAALSVFLKAMENPVLVWTLVLITIGIRVLYVQYRRHHPLPPVSAAPTSSKPKKSGAKQQDATERIKDASLETIDTILIALILVFGIVRPFILQTFFIPSGSMEPTLKAPVVQIVNGRPKQTAGGDKLIANKFIYRFREPRRGEIVIFQPPTPAVVGTDPTLQLPLRQWIEANPNTLTADETNILRVTLAGYAKQIPGQPAGNLAEATVQNEAQLLYLLPQVPARPDDYIKRIIAVPGDRIHAVAGKGIFINGKPLDEPYLPGGKSASTINFPVAPPAPEPAPRLKDFSNKNDAAPDDMMASLFANQFLTWLGRSWIDYARYQQSIAPYVHDGDLVVPPHAIFVMGDNRSSGGSFDSRYWGIVPYANIRAVAVSTFWPLQRLKVL